MAAGGLRDIPRARLRYLNQLAAPGTSPKTLASLSSHEDVAVRVVCASHAGTPVEALRALARDPRREVRQAAATNPAMPRRVIRSLTRDPVHDVTLTAAQNPSIGRGYLNWILGVRRTDATLCRAAALNPAATPFELRLALTNARWDVRRNAVRHANITAAQLTRQARSPFWSVRAEVAGNPTTPAATLRQLAHDLPPVALAVAGSPLTPTEIVDQLLAHQSPYVRGVAAGNVNASPELLARMAERMDEDPWVLRRLARNSSLAGDHSAELLAWLALGGAGEGDPEFDPVRCSGGPPGTRARADRWYRDRAAESERPELHALWRTRAESVSLGGKVPIRRLRVLARDAHAEGRWAAARFPDLDLSILRELSRDESPSVATTARWSMDRSQNWDHEGLSRYRRWTRVAVAIAWPVLVIVSVLLVTGVIRDAGGTGSAPAIKGTTAPPVTTSRATRPKPPEDPHLAFGNVVARDQQPIPPGAAVLPGGGWVAGEIPPGGAAGVDVDLAAGAQPLSIDVVTLVPRSGSPTKVFRVVTLAPNTMLAMHYSGRRALARVRVHYVSEDNGPGTAEVRLPKG